MTDINSMNTLVSVTICTYNRADQLREALASLIAQRVDFDYEIVVVDNLSTDHTQSVIEEVIRTSAVTIRSFVEPSAGVSAARNRSIREARGEWIASVDDDELADPNWLQQLVDAARSRGIRCVGGRVQLQLEEDEVATLSVVCRSLLGESALGDREQRYTRRFTPGAGNLMVHRSVFDQVGLYDESLREGGEDTDLFRRIRQAAIEAWYVPTAVVRHLVPDYRLSPRYLLWSAERNGWHVARREHRAGSAARFVMMMAIRLGQLSLRYLPRYLLARALRHNQEALGARCLLRRTRAYLRCGLALMAPRAFRGSPLSFRSEREMFSSS